MTPVLASLALLTSTGALLMVPLAPALRELIHKRDAGPLVTRKDDGDISSFATSLRTRCIALQATLQDCDLRAENELIEFSPGSAFVVGQHGNWRGPRHASMLVACGGPVELPAGFQSTEDFYSRGSVRCGQQSIFRALLSEEEIALGNDTQILRWIHAQSSLSAGTHCRLYGRASSAKSITLSAGSIFERIYAPVIYSSREGAALSLRNDYAAYSRLAQSGIGRTRIHSHMHLSADEQHRGDVVATRTISLGHGASVLGSVKASGEIVLKERAEVHGSLVSTKRIHISSGCFVKGPIIAEREVIIESGVQVGLPGTPTTVSAPLIHLASGSVLHGTAWAKIEGRVGD